MRALANATITRRVIVILLIAAHWIALFIIAARRRRRGKSAFNRLFDRVIIGDPVQDDGSIDDPVLTTNQDRGKSASAVRINAGFVAGTMTCDS
jgi:hypothetical protein